jgi:hypothetical protein
MGVIGEELLRLFVTVATLNYRNDFEMMGGLSQPVTQQWIVWHQRDAGLWTFQTMRRRA